MTSSSRSCVPTGSRGRDPGGRDPGGPNRSRGTGPAGATRDEWAPRPVPWNGWVDRVRASRRARRLVPTGLALAATDHLARLSLRVSARRRAEVTALVDAVVAGTPEGDDLPRLAAGYVCARARGWELSWREWELERVPIHGLEHIARARDSGRGLIVSHCHLGPLACWVALARHLGPLLAPQGDWLTDDPVPGYHGYQVEHWRRVYTAAGVRMLHNVGSGLRVYQTLRAGGSVLLALDTPGGRRTRFLGKPVDLDDGTAELAVRTGALVAPVALLPNGRRWDIHVLEPLDPGTFGSADELHLRLAGIHEELILRAPEHLECPPEWLWGRVTRDGWFRR